MTTTRPFVFDYDKKGSRYAQRPHHLPPAFLDKEIKKAQSAWGFLSEEQQDILIGRLAADLQSGNWDKKFGPLRSQPWFTGALRLIIADLR